MEHIYKKFIFISLVLLWFIFPQNKIFSQSGERFPFGVYALEHWYENYEQIKEMGANTIVQYAKRPEGGNPGNLQKLAEFDNVIALNYLQSDPIHHYSGGYYKKWNAEEVISDLKSGIKHIFGEEKNIGGDLYWSTGNQTAPRDSFVYGPHYAQDKKYRQGYVNPPTITYLVKFRIRLETQPAQPVDVCKLKIRYRYELGLGKDTVLVSQVVNSDTLSTSEFREITLTYSYPQRFIPSENAELKFIDGPAQSTTVYDDRIEGTGIEFVVDYLGGARIAVDFIEVYDQLIWGEFLAAPGTIADQIIDYATSSGFNPISQKLRYWHSQDAPLTLDGYEPYRVIDSILNSTQIAKPIITDYYPMWNGMINGRGSFERWNTLAQPKQLMFWYYPTWKSDSPEPHSNMPFLLDLLRQRLQEAQEIKPDFYYLAPTMNFKFGENEDWYYRKPEGTELRSMLMLALSHGAKGLFFMHYYSYMVYDNQGNPIYLRCDGLVNIPESSYTPSPLWHFIKDNISPRMNGALGRALLSLNYTGNFIQLKFFIPSEDPLPPPPTYDYLTIGLTQTPAQEP